MNNFSVSSFYWVTAVNSLLTRQKKKKSELAKGIEMSEPNLYKCIKRGSIELKYLYKMAEFFDVPLIYLLEERWAEKMSPKGIDSIAISDKNEQISDYQSEIKDWNIKVSDFVEKLNTSLENFERGIIRAKELLDEKDKLIAEKDKLIAEKERLIKILLKEEKLR